MASIHRANQAGWCRVAFIGDATLFSALSLEFALSVIFQLAGFVALLEAPDARLWQLAEQGP